MREIPKSHTQRRKQNAEELAEPWAHGGREWPGGSSSCKDASQTGLGPAPMASFHLRPQQKAGCSEAKSLGKVRRKKCGQWGGEKASLFQPGLWMERKHP